MADWASHAGRTSGSCQECVASESVISSSRVTQEAQGISGKLLSASVFGAPCGSGVVGPSGADETVTRMPTESMQSDGNSRPHGVGAAERASSGEMWAVASTWAVDPVGPSAADAVDSGVLEVPDAYRAADLDASAEIESQKYFF